MSLVTPAYVGGESVVGFAREGTWGDAEVSVAAHPNKAFGSVAHPAKFAALKEETFDVAKNADPQLDDMIGDREVARIIENGNTIEGGLRGNVGPEFIGYLFTMLFGTPDTTMLVDSSGTLDAAFQHVWYPGYNTRANWPASYSFESRLSSVKSKLITGALLRRLAIDLANNAPVVITPDFIAMAMQILQGAGTSGTLDDAGDTLPCILTANPTLIDETPWHWQHLVAYPEIDDLPQQSVMALNFEFAFPDMRGLFTGGGGLNIGTWAADKFQLSGRATILFEDETIFYKIKNGSYMKIEATLEGATIQGANKYSLAIAAYSAKSSNPGVANRVGDLQYEIPFTCREDPTEGKSCQITLVNSVSSYAA